MTKTITICPFKPVPIFRNPHIQTIMGAFLRSTKGVLFERQRINTPDDDFIDLDFACEKDGPRPNESAPIVLVLHGLGGSAQGTYAYETYRQLAQLGVRSVGMNYRSCSGEVNNAPRTYHAGATDDVAIVVDWLHQQYPGIPLGLIGFSLGANLVLKFLGEIERKVTAAAAVSPPFDLTMSARVLARWSRRPYTQSILSALQKGIQQKAHQLGGIVDTKQVMKAKTLDEFDRVSTVPLHGFRTVEDYYEQCASKRFLSTIHAPTLIIRALDDPFFDARDIPYELIAQNPCLRAEFPRYGGHVGFAEGFPGRLTWWANQQASLFLANHLLPIHGENR